MGGDLQEFNDFVDKITGAGLRYQQGTKVDLKEPDEADVQILFEAYYSRGD